MYVDLSSGLPLFRQADMRPCISLSGLGWVSSETLISVTARVTSHVKNARAMDVEAVVERNEGRDEAENCSGTSCGSPRPEPVARLRDQAQEEMTRSV